MISDCGFSGPYAEVREGLAGQGSELAEEA